MQESIHKDPYYCFFIIKVGPLIIDQLNIVGGYILLGFVICGLT
jgi:hypothetical protein